MRISAVIPARNEEASLDACLDAVAAALARCSDEREIIVIDDGSTDGTWLRIEEAARARDGVRGLRFTRNFGKEMAILAGLRAARGDAVIVLDADLQHPPELIPELVDCWKRLGVSVVEAVRRVRPPESRWRRLATRLYYWSFRKLAHMDVAVATDYKLLDRSVVDEYLSLPERARFFRGLTEWMAFPSAQLSFDPPARAGRAPSRWRPADLWSLGFSSLSSFSAAPLRVTLVIGALGLLVTLVIGVQTVARWLLGATEPGFPTVILLQVGLGSAILLGIGILGEYLARVYEEVKARPYFVIRARTDSPSETPEPAPRGSEPPDAR